MFFVSKKKYDKKIKEYILQCQVLRKEKSQLENDWDSLYTLHLETKQEKDEIIKKLENENKKLKEELEELKNNSVKPKRSKSKSVLEKVKKGEL